MRDDETLLQPNPHICTKHNFASQSWLRILFASRAWHPHLQVLRFLLLRSTPALVGLLKTFHRKKRNNSSKAILGRRTCASKDEILIKGGSCGYLSMTTSLKTEEKKDLQG